MTAAVRTAREPRHAVPLTVCDQVAAEPDGELLQVTGSARIRGDGPYLVDHFPEVAVFPGVFVLEAVTQAVAQALGERDGRSPRLRAIGSLRLLAPLRPGDRMTLRARVAPLPDPTARGVTAQCRRGDGVLVATMTLECGWSR